MMADPIRCGPCETTKMKVLVTSVGTEVRCFYCDELLKEIEE